MSFYQIEDISTDSNDDLEDFANLVRHINNLKAFL
jgi:hypothetical protein